ncbi:MAG: sigma-70 family RNA polymerase sigma factor [Candidatus Eisenbacteria bacterium]|nr:sigma-70 family RNA polymerase sigma factor [Candidatus Latescibacterota bacterium]MBD3301869.1 sigma-70 family RNA polymerase sigma factor [Candidatus Eisenbacteria bacterium]
MTDDLQTLVARLRAGEEDAWQLYMRRYGRIASIVAHRFHLGEEEAQELFQITFLGAYRSIDRLRDPEKLGTWTYGIAYRSAISFTRKKKQEISAEEIGEGSYFDRLPDDAPSPDDELERLDTARRLRQTVARMAAPCRPLLEALYLTEPEPSYQEVSRRLDMPIGSIGPTRGRCLEKLREMLGKVSGDAPIGTTSVTGRTRNPGRRMKGGNKR